MNIHGGRSKTVPVSVWSCRSEKPSMLMGNPWYRIRQFRLTEPYEKPRKSGKQSDAGGSGLPPDL